MQEIGTLLVRLLFDDRGFNTKAQGALKQYQRTTQGFGIASVVAGQLIADAFREAGRAITSLVSDVVQTGAAFQLQIDQVGAIAGATASQLQELEAQARKLGQSTIFTATQAAGGLQALAQAGLNVDDAIRVSGDALNFATAQQVELSSATQVLVAGLRQFNLGVEESARVVDVMTLATQRSLADFESLREAMKFGGSTGAAFGLSIEETTAALAKFRDLGLEGSLAGTVFRQALAQSTMQTDRQAEALERLGLRFEDIAISETNRFTDVVDKLAGSALEATDAIDLFGVRAGPSIAALVASARKGTLGLRELTAELENASGTADTTVRRVSDNVSTQARIVMSALEEVFLQVFDSIKGPIQDALEAIAPFLVEVAAAVDEVGERIDSSLGAAIDRFNDALGRNGPETARALAGALQTVVDVAAALLNSLSALLDAFGLLAGAIRALGLTGIVDDLAVITGMVAALTAAVGTLSVAIGGTAGPAGGFGAVIAGLGGPLGAAVVAVAALTAGFISYRVAVAEAEEVTRTLEAALGEVQARRDAVLADVAGDLAGDLDGVRARTLEYAAAQRQAAAEGAELTTAVEEEIAALEALAEATDEEIRVQVLSGELVEVEGQLRTVASLVEELDPDKFTQIEENARRFRQEAEAIERNLEGVRQRLEEAQQIAQDQGGRFAVFEFGTEEATRRFIEEQELRRDALLHGERTLIRQRQKAQEDLLTREGQIETERTRKAEQEANRRAIAADREADDRIAAAERAASEIAKIQAGADREAAGLFLTDAQAVQRDLQVQEQAIRSALDDFLANFSGTEAERVQVIEQAEGAIAQVRANARQHLQALELQAGEARVNAARRTAQQLARFTGAEVTQQQQIREQAADLLTQIEEAAATERAAIADEYGARIAQVETATERIDLVRERNSAIAELDRRLGQQREQIARTTDQQIQQVTADGVEAARQAAAAAVQAAEDMLRQSVDDFFAQPGVMERRWKAGIEKIREVAATEFPVVTRLALDVGKAIGSVGDALGAVARTASQAFQALTGGFALDIQGMVGEVVSAGQDAEEAVVQAQAALDEVVAARRSGEATTEDIRAAQAELAEAQAAAEQAAGGALGAELVQTLAEGAITFVQTLAREIGPILQSFAEAIPQVVQEVADNLNTIVGELVTALPGVISALGDAVVSLIGALPQVVDTLLAGLPEIIAALLAQIPEIIDALVVALPRILDAIIANLPAIFDAIIAGLPAIVVALAEAIPVLLTAALEAIPEIIGELVRAIPLLVLALIAAVPDIILALIAGLPDLIAALVSFGPHLIAEMVAQLPELVVAFVSVLFTELIPSLPQIAFELVKAIPAALLEIFKDLVKIFGDLFKAALNPLKGLFKGGEDKEEGRGFLGGLFGGGGDDNQSAQQGVPWVARTSRMLVHAGERILAAHENRPATAAGSSTRNPVQSGAGQPGVFGGGGGSSWDLTIKVGDTTIDRLHVDADGRGGLAFTNRSNRRKTGTYTAFRRPS